MIFGLKLAKSPQTGTQKIKIKSSVKSRAKDYENSSSGSMGSSSKTWSWNFGLSNRFLNKKKQVSV
jgi:hypothetical protein